MIGLDAVKQSVQNLFDMTILNYRRELKELQSDAVSLNRVFLGSPGTGKTTVAKHCGQILAELGLISNGEGVFVVYTLFFPRFSNAMKLSSKTRGLRRKCFRPVRSKHQIHPRQYCWKGLDH
jgi:SpoVK/Ycf46/Vps4 family AAA+-type ATPase